MRVVLRLLSCSTAVHLFPRAVFESCVKLGGDGLVHVCDLMRAVLTAAACIYHYMYMYT